MLNLAVFSFFFLHVCEYRLIMYRNKHLTRCDLLLDVTVSSFSIFDDVKQNKKIKKKNHKQKFSYGLLSESLDYYIKP